jgi:hypothetical protein
MLWPTIDGSNNYGVLVHVLGEVLTPRLAPPAVVRRRHAAPMAHVRVLTDVGSG